MDATTTSLAMIFHVAVEAFSDEINQLICASPSM